MPVKMKSTTTNHGSEYVAAAGCVVEFHTCGECGVTWGMAKTFVEQRRNDGKWWQCPNGHSWRFSGENEEERLRRQLEDERARAGRLASQRDQLQASLRAQKAATTRARNERKRMLERVANGVCPCCNRSFTNVRRHMASKHPDVLAELKQEEEAAADA